MFSARDGLRFNGFAPEPLAGTAATLLDLRLTDSAATAVAATALPPAAAAFDRSRYPATYSVGPVRGLLGRSLVVTLGSDQGSVTGQITYRLDGLTVTAVPAPPAAGLLAVGAGVAGLLARVSRRAGGGAAAGSGPAARPGCSPRSAGTPA